ncbi:SusC/RagA family TonB-linked outer membrane protein [Algoriphagus zhangzhouensis]|uniref:TonB-linked outer membrane protein, SusC/RagA family n=1 Tax=Algoriphagus zhangzhouensis TaxID=1073327 RepID=A0A1M7ZBM3_9BACT|nr:TonB-dependent receptor [Algoriphagus zhangzhouensis]TDY46778.1 TonB-linked SusC/RagA family outer membrane protein [Algoriphagus zhangzhouensis]SHO62263.1 TonB-linked outer membrane protein, SusC/RagA family [Algoriphagus zhangzhouensis]
MKKVLLGFVFTLLTTLSVLAQNKTITGRVTSPDEPEGLIGVNVLVKGTTIGVVTDLDGGFSLSVPENATTLVFSYIGYSSVEEVIGNRSVINVSMELDSQNLDEVIVTAYGTADKGNFTGSAIALKGDQIANRPINNVVNAIEGQSPGVITTSASGQPGSTPGVRIRGIGSVNSSSSPLYVVDGVPYDAAISNLNPDDIEDMTILKDAASAALYGSRAANGVIMITTKKGKKNKSNFNFRVQTGTASRALPEYDRVNAGQYYPLVWESLRNAQLGNGATESDAAAYASSNLIDNVLGYNVYNVPNDQVVGADGTLNPNAVNNFTDLDWFDYVAGSGGRQEYNMTYSGGTEKSDFYTSVGYLDEKGFVVNSDFQRWTGRLNVNTNPTKWFKTGVNLSATMSEGNNARTGGSSSYVNPMFFARNMGPIYPVYAQNNMTGGYIFDEFGGKIFDTGDLINYGLPRRGTGGSPGRHAYQEALLNVDRIDRDVISARAYAEVTFLQHFALRTNISTDVTSLLDIGYDNPIVGDGAPAGRTNRTNARTNSMTFNQLLTYTNTFKDKHFLEVLVGHENYDYKYNYQYLAKQDQILDGNIEPDNFVTISSANGRVDRHRIESYLSRVNYVFDDKYSVSGSFRTDGSSKFYEDVRWGYFYSIGGAWNIDKENFFDSQFFDMLKLRASYGEVGNDAIGGYYPWQALYDLGYNNASEPGILQASLAAPDLLWESNNTFDLGLDFAFARRFTGSVEYFQRQSENLLFEVPLSLTTGLSNKLQNIGTLANSGIEFTIQGDLIRSEDFKWSASFNVSTFKNEFKSLPFDEQIDGTKKLVVGRSIYDYWLRDWYGVDPETGEGLYRAESYDEDDANTRIIGQDTVTTQQNNAKYHFAGSAIPDFFGGLSNTFSYKGLTLNVLLSYSVGGKVYDGVYASLMSADPDGNALHVDAMNRWTTPGQITDVPKMDVTGSAQTNAASDRWLIDGSYLNFRSVNLSYTLPKTLLERINVAGATVYVAGENLGWISARKGMYVSGTFNGTTSNTYTPARTFTVGLNVNL